MNRRDALSALGALLLLACDDDPASGGGPADAEPDARPDLGPVPDDWQRLRPTLEALYPEDEALRAIGRAWLQPLDSETISSELDAVVALIDDDVDATRRRLDEAINAELDDLVLAVVAGWHLAPTEARLCGLLERTAPT